MYTRVRSSLELIIFEIFPFLHFCNERFHKERCFARRTIFAYWKRADHVILPVSLVQLVKRYEASTDVSFHGDKMPLYTFVATKRFTILCRDRVK